MAQDETTTLKDINDRIQDLIVKSLETSSVLYVRGDEVAAYKALKDVFWKIAPFDFSNKNYLMQVTQQIDIYLKETESRGGKPNLAQVIIVNQKRSELNELIEEYFKLIPFCLKELNLYLRIIKRNDDPDEVFSEETFNTNESLLDRKKEELKTVESKWIIDMLTPRQVHDVHARLLTYRDAKGMAFIEEKKR